MILTIDMTKMKFEEIPKEQWPKNDPKPPLRVFKNNKFLVQIIYCKETIRITVNRTEIQCMKRDGSPQWKESISWDELQEIKNYVGYENHWMVEIYPPKDKVENVANMRHLWLLDRAPSFGWNK